MAVIKVIANNYGGQFTHINGTTDEQISSFDIFRSFLTVGAIGWFGLVHYYGWRGLWIRIGESLIMPGFVEMRNGLCLKSPAFDRRIQSDKTAVTYCLGMAFTKFAAARRLMVPWLCHVDRLLDQGVLTLTAGTNQRGDLLGMDRNGLWHVFEAKGRSSKERSSLIKTAKAQASRIKSINGTTPSTASASIIRLFTKPISVELIDPMQQEHNRETSWNIDPPEYFSAYYHPFIEYLNNHHPETVRIFDLEYNIAKLEAFGRRIWIGLPQIIRENPVDALKLANIFYQNKIHKRQDYKEDYQVSVGYDGILVAGSFNTLIRYSDREQHT
jgi:hypothetical protein